MKPRFSSPFAQFLLCAAGIGLVALLAHFFGLTLCPLKRLTGIPCPTCGTTRACLLLLRGHPRDAFAMQPFALVGIPLLILWILSPRVRAFSAALWKHSTIKLLALLLLLLDWLYVFHHGN